MKKWMKWGLFLLLLLGVAKAEDRSFRFLYAYDGTQAPRYYHSNEYVNRIWGYRIAIPTNFHDGIIISQSTWGIMLQPSLSKRARGFLMGESFDVTGFGPVADLKRVCEDEKRLMLKSGPHRHARLLHYEFAGDHCRIEVEGHLGNEPFGLQAYLARKGQRGVIFRMQYPPAWRQLYHRLFDETAASLRWMPVPAGWTAPSYRPVTAVSAKHPTSPPPASTGQSAATPVGNSVSPVAGMPAGEKTPAHDTEWANGYDYPLWGIHLRFPPGFFINPPLKTRDYGVVFVSPDRRGLLYLSWAETPASLKQIYRTSLQKMRQNPDLRISYRRIAGDWFVISTINRAKGTISYMKGYKEGRKFALYLLVYPEGDKGRYDGLIPTLNRQFGPTGHGRKRQPYRKHRHLSGRCCDAMARACYAECPDDDSGCLERCEARRDRCYSSGRW